EYDKLVEQQHFYFKRADLVLNVSQRGMEVLLERSPDINCMAIPIGQEIEYYSNYETHPEPNTVLFYGSMGNQQNVHAFDRYWNKIHPLLKERVPEAKLLVVGANPSEKIMKLHNGEDVIVTGFVDDPREYLAKATVMILPMETSAGFRGRAVEIMAMGIPLVGTHNALDNLEMTDGVHGFIADDDSEMVEHMVRLMKDPQLRKTISEQALKFVTDKYSREATTGKLSKYYTDLKIEGKE
ncbi:MAG: glycosyltransferase, partial [bacterium]|nr:glycosyltransferase [bacterium]